MSALSVLYDRLVLGRPRTVLLMLLAVLAFFAYHVPQMKLDASADSLLLENDKDLKRFRELTNRYETKELLFVTFTPHEDLFADSSLAHIGSLRERLRALPRTDSVQTILDVPLVKLVGGALSDAVANYRTLLEPGVDRAEARRELIESPLYRDQIVSPDGQTTALAIYLKVDAEYERLLRERDRLQGKRRDATLTDTDARLLDAVLADYDAAKNRLDAANHANIEAIRAIMDDYRDYGSLHLGGVTMIADDITTFIRNDLAVFGAGIFVFLVVMLTSIFRRMRWVLLPLASCVYAGVVMVGVLGLMGWRVTVISSNFISLMLILTLSMNIHLVVRFRELNRDNADRSHRDLVGTTARRMVWPCLYTALTTMVGFSSLVVSDIRPVIDFGWMMTLGLGVTFLTTFLLFPATLALIGAPDAGDVPKRGVPFTAALAAIAERHGNKVLAVAVALAVVGVFGISLLKVENSFINYFRQDTEIAQGLRLIDERLGGTTPLDVVLKFPQIVDDTEPDWGLFPEDERAQRPGAETGGEEDELFDDLDDLFSDTGEDTGEPDDVEHANPERNREAAWFTDYKVDRIKRVHEHLEGLDAIGKVLSFASGLKVAEDLNQGPLGPLVLQVMYKRLPDELKAVLVDPYISIDHDEARITMRVVDSLPDLRRKALLERIESDLKGELGLPEDEVEVSGLLVLYNNMLQSLFKSQIVTLGVVMLGIAAMLLFLFRSVLLAVLGIIPNILSAGLILGIMGLMDIPLDMMTITIAAITIGIAVDNCIHYIYRFREEFPKRGEYAETLHYCHANIGRAAYYTSVTIIVGFSILVLSNFVPTIYFGILTALAMGVALLGALTLLPKLILMTRPFGRQRG